MATMPSSFFLRVSRRLMNCGCPSYRATTSHGFQEWYVCNRVALVQARSKSFATAEEAAFTQENKNDSHSELSFEWRQLQTAYESRRIGELLRGIFVLKLCSYDTFVVNCMQVSI